MGNQRRQVRRPFCKWAPLNQNTEGQLLERRVLSSLSMKKPSESEEKVRRASEEKEGMAVLKKGGQSSVTKQARPWQTLRGPAFKSAWEGGDGREMDGGQRGHWSRRTEREREQRAQEWLSWLKHELINRVLWQKHSVFRLYVSVRLT